MNEVNLELNSSKQKQNETLSPEARIVELSSTIEELNELCKVLDPYQPIDQAMEKRLSKYGIFEMDNPFLITNKLVLILENSVEELIELGGTP